MGSVEATIQQNLSVAVRCDNPAPVLCVEREHAGWPDDDAVEVSALGIQIVHHVETFRQGLQLPRERYFPGLATEKLSAFFREFVDTPIGP